MFKNWSDTKVKETLLALNGRSIFRSDTPNNCIMRSFVDFLYRKNELSNAQLNSIRYRFKFYKETITEIFGADYLLEDDKKKPNRAFSEFAEIRIFCTEDNIAKSVLPKVQARKEDDFWYCEKSKKNVHILKNHGFGLDESLKEYLETNNRIRSKRLPFNSLQRPPFNYQKEGVLFAFQKNGRILLSDEQGIGKTGQAIIYAHFAEKKKIVVVCPSSLKANWKREIEIWTGDTSCGMLFGTKPLPLKKELKKNASKVDIAKRKEAQQRWEQHIESYMNTLIESRWLILNYDLLNDWHDILNIVKPDCIIFDEAQALKNPTTNRTKSAKQFCKKKESVLFLSGTPVENRPIEFWSIISILEPHLFKNKTAFEDRYCNAHIDKFGYRNIKGSSNMKELHKILTDTFMLRRKKTEVLKDLPPKTRAIVPIMLSDSKMKEYKRIELDFKEWLKETKGLKNFEKKGMALVRLNALKRFASSNKLESVKEWMENFFENESKLVVFAHYHETIDTIASWYKNECVVIDGRVPVPKRQDLVDKFQNDPKTKLFIGNLKAAGTGLTLTASCNVLTVELAWTSTSHDQADDRCARIGQTRPVTAYYLVAYNTIEEMIVKLLEEKREMLEELFDGEEKVDVKLLDNLIKEMS